MAAPYPPLDGTEPCATGDPERFFPLRGQYLQARQVKHECQGCHVREQCLAYALGRDLSGIWGGMDRRERRNYQRKHRIELVKDVDLDAQLVEEKRREVLRLFYRGIPQLSIARLLGMAPEHVTAAMADYRGRPMRRTA